VEVGTDTSSAGIAAAINAAAEEAGGQAGAVRASVGTGVDAGKIILTEQAVDGVYSNQGFTLANVGTGTAVADIFGTAPDTDADSYAAVTGDAPGTATNNQFAIDVAGADGTETANI